MHITLIFSDVLVSSTLTLPVNIYTWKKKKPCSPGETKILNFSCTISNNNNNFSTATRLHINSYGCKQFLKYTDNYGLSRAKTWFSLEIPDLYGNNT